MGKLFAAAREAEAGSYYVSSGYRDFERQRRAYDEALDKTFVQPPGYSEHQTGLAADILAVGVAQYDLGASPEGRWLADNAWQYGLILRYGQDKQNITGIAYEPWHFRYVGQPHAWYCRKYDLSLEEYIRFLQDSGGYSAEVDGIVYTVIYQTPRNGALYLPESREYSVSGDNTGGYIITAW